MNQKKLTPAILATIVLIIVEIINFAEVVPLSQWGSFEQISNCIMFAIAIIGFFLTGFPYLSGKRNDLKIILGNVAVSVIAFPMNIGVFHHILSMQSFKADIWGIHLCWIALGVIQILLLSELGRFLLNILKYFIGWVTEILKLASLIILNLFNAISRADYRVILSALFCSVCWIAFIIFKIKKIENYPISDIPADSIWIWIVGLGICFLFQSFSSVKNKMINAIDQMKSIDVFHASLYVLICVLTVFLPLPFKNVMVLILPFYILMRLKDFSMKKIFCFFRNPARKKKLEEIGINTKDLKIVLFSFSEFPLLIIIALTFISSDGIKIIATQNPSNITTWINLINAAIEASNNFLSLFGLNL